MAFTAKDVQALREKTGCGMMDCKKALTASDGDMDKAIDFLREKGLAASAKKASRIAAEGAVVIYSENDITVVLEVNAETDFVAKNEKFTTFATEVAKVVARENPADVDALLECKEESGVTVADDLKDKIYTIGENMKIRRFVRMEGVVGSYVHGGGSIGVLVKFETTGGIESKPEFAAAAKNVAMQVAAMNPAYLDKDSVPADELEKEKAIQLQQVIESGKPANIAEKIVMGKMGKFYKENCLTEQAFVMNDKESVSQYMDGVAKELGGTVKFVEFVRMVKGEGLEKKSENFADEVAGMIK